MEQVGVRRGAERVANHQQRHLFGQRSLQNRLLTALLTALLSALLLAGTLESNPIALLYRLPAAYACEEATDLIRGIICRNHGIYLSHIKIRLNWNGVGTLVCCIWNKFQTLNYSV